MSSNQLAAQTSPYLALHKNDPVHWRPWGPEAFAEAQANNKPVLLSVGYSACHWCHVMHHESFADPDTAAYMNENFVNVKVDREERPDVDLLYQAAAGSMGQSTGWPLTAFLTPNGECFYSGTYFPKQQSPTHPAFKSLLIEIARIWRETPDAVRNSAAKVEEQYRVLWGKDVRGSIDLMAFERYSIRIAQMFDIFYGGINGAPKFPNTGLIEVLLRGYMRSGAPPFLQLAFATLDNLSMGGIYDHVGGGFFRYATDEHWYIPHFEKMLYDNALIVDILTLTWQLNRGRLYQERVEETIDWLMREMKVEGAFASSLDADSEGEEGKYYVWSEAEIDAALAGTFSQRFKETYAIRPPPALHGKYILHRLSPAQPYPLADADEALMKRQRELLLAARQKRVPPRRDDKIVTDWNAMTVHALARAGAAFGKPEWIAQAQATFDFLLKAVGEGDRLFHIWIGGKRSQPGFADDYAHMANAALTLWQVTGRADYLERAKAWVRVLDQHFWDSQMGGYYLTPDDGEILIARSRSVFDQATPCANGLMVGVLAQLHFATLDKAYRDRSNALIEAFGGQAPRGFSGMSTYLNGFDTIVRGFQIVIVGPRQNPKTQQLVRAVYGRCLPMATLVVVDSDEELPESHPAFGKKMEQGQPTAYICALASCSAPITNPVDLSQALRLPTQRVAGQA